MLLLEPGGAAQAGGSRSGSVACGCGTGRRSCARFCSLHGNKFSRNALASRASRAACSILFFGVIRGGSLILQCNERGANLSRSHHLRDEKVVSDPMKSALMSIQKQRKSRSHPETSGLPSTGA